VQTLIDAGTWALAALPLIVGALFAIDVFKLNPPHNK
jgi:hypothetical protein